MNDKLKVSLKEAVDLAKKGYEIECFVLIAPQGKKDLRKRTEYIAPSAIITLSLDGKEPCKGELLTVWGKVKKELWGKDATANYTRAKVDETIRKYAPKKSWIFSNLCGRLKCIRVITP